MFKSLLGMLMFITALNFEPEGFFVVTQCIYFKWIIFYISLEIRLEMPSLSLLLMSHRIINYVEGVLQKLIQSNPLFRNRLIRSVFFRAMTSQILNTSKDRGPTTPLGLCSSI